MITSRQRIQYILSASLLASAAFGASAQTPPPAVGSTASPPAVEHRMNRPHDGKFMERMQERRTKHMADLKTKLKLDASQETAWSAFAAASQPPGPPPGRDPKAARAEFEKMTTPQRLDRMQARQADHAAMFAKRAESTRTFYAALTPVQQKTFDAETLRHGHRGEHGRRGPDGHRPPPPAPAKS
jgi:hypothetical protein